MSLFSELRRRNVLKVALLYAVASWLLVWIVDRLIDGLYLSPWVGDYVLLLSEFTPALYRNGVV